MTQKRSSSTRSTLQNNTELGPGICPKSPKHTRIIEVELVDLLEYSKFSTPEVILAKFSMLVQAPTSRYYPDICTNFVIKSTIVLC